MHIIYIYLYATAFALIVLTAHAEPKDTVDPICARGTLSNPDLHEIGTLKNGAKLHVCGLKLKNGSVTETSLYLEKKDGTVVAQPMNLGGISEAYGPFSTNSIKFKFTPDGLIVTDLIPVHADEYVPSFERAIVCKDSCADTQNKCVFRKIREKPDPSATIIITKAVKGSRLPNSQELMEGYRNALAGDKSALNALLDKRLLKKLDKAYSEEVHAGSFAHECIADVLGKLKRSGCL